MAVYEMRVIKTFTHHSQSLPFNLCHDSFMQFRQLDAVLKQTRINPPSKSHPDEEDLFPQPVTSLCQILDRKPLWTITGRVIRVRVLWKESVKSQDILGESLDTHICIQEQYKASLYACVREKVNDVNYVSTLIRTLWVALWTWYTNTRNCSWRFSATLHTKSSLHEFTSNPSGLQYPAGLEYLLHPHGDYSQTDGGLHVGSTR